MAINLSDNILAKTTAPGDAKYGPYTGSDLAAAKSAATTYLQASFRYEGLTVGLIVGSNDIVEYWFKGGVADSNLILKQSGGGDVEVANDGTTVEATTDKMDFVSGIKATAVSGTDGVTIDTTFNSVVDDDLEVGTTVGGVASGTKASALKDLNMVTLMETILFPTQLPTYTLPTSALSLSGFATSQEIGSTISPSSSLTGVKNDAGAISNVTIEANLNSAGYSNLATGAGTATTPANVPNQFGFTNPNNPNAGRTLAVTQDSYQVPAPSSGTRSVFQYRAKVTVGAGQAKKDNKGTDDTRSAGTSVNSPQSARTITSSVSTRYGYWPYYYGKSSSQQTAAQVEALIEGGTYVSKQVKNAAGTLSMSFGASGEWVWFAIPEGFADKTKWYVDATNNGNIGSNNTDLFAAGSVRSIASEDGYWTKNFKVYVAQKVTTIDDVQIKES